jgi:hypothetical protein
VTAIASKSEGQTRPAAPRVCERRHHPLFEAGSSNDKCRPRLSGVNIGIARTIAALAQAKSLTAGWPPSTAVSRHRRPFRPGRRRALPNGRGVTIHITSCEVATVLRTQSRRRGTSRPSRLVGS